MCLIIDYEQCNEEYRHESKENLYLILWQKDRSIAPFKCGASGVLKKTLENDNQFYKLFRTHEFTHNSEKQLKKFPESVYNDFSILVRPKVKLNPP